MKDDELIDTEALMIVQKILDWRKSSRRLQKGVKTSTQYEIRYEKALEINRVLFLY